ncbi:hypothetical protein GOC09_06255 [Sinorhizobium meliloti]|nr:hypothetical protein [Sinorhizobium meliloti]MDW9835202.1 hypothetical protein [Sinorhizobium meliloti]MDX0038857.1 hypothetical protein [Sinorhizobium meliloti]MDX0086837.1 hypothetical protein [Sinorhizobium meliloti]
MELAKGVAESFGVFAIFDVETVLRSPAITPFVSRITAAKRRVSNWKSFGKRVRPRRKIGASF